MLSGNTVSRISGSNTPLLAFVRLATMMSESLPASVSPIKPPIKDPKYVRPEYMSIDSTKTPMGLNITLLLAIEAI